MLSLSLTPPPNLLPLVPIPYPNLSAALASNWEGEGEGGGGRGRGGGGMLWACMHARKNGSKAKQILSGQTATGKIAGLNLVKDTFFQGQLVRPESRVSGGKLLFQARRQLIQAYCKLGHVVPVARWTDSMTGYW